MHCLFGSSPLPCVGGIILILQKWKLRLKRLNSSALGACSHKVFILLTHLTCLLSTCHVPGPVLGTGDKAVSETGTVTFMELKN